MTLKEIKDLIKQQMDKAKYEKNARNPFTDLRNFRYYQGRQEAFSTCLELLEILEEN
jgi:hypothetical protein